MSMLLAAYSLAVATVYALLYVAAPQTADASMLFFVVAVLLPAVGHDVRRRRDG